MVVEGVNIVIKHIKRGRARQAGRVEVEAPLHVSKVMLIGPETKEPTRVGIRKNADGKNERYLQEERQDDSAAERRLAADVSSSVMTGGLSAGMSGGPGGNARMATRTTGRSRRWRDFARQVPGRDRADA